MKLFQPIFAIFLAILVSAYAQENCDAICQERVNQAVEPVNAEKLRAEEWGWEQKRELDATWEKLRAAEGETERMRTIAQEQEQAANNLRGQLENAQRDFEAVRGELDQLKHSSSHEIDVLRTKAEEATRTLGGVQFALDEANDQIKEMESSRISINLKGIGEDVKQYWSKLISFWTGLVVKEKKDEDL